MATKLNKTNESASPLIELHELGVSFGRQPVLRDINLSIPRGQTLGIIGESGCGKTVLLKLIIGLLRTTHGHVLVDGQRIDQLGDKELTALRTKFGFLFQGAALFDSMTVFENIAFPLRENGELPRRRLKGKWPSAWLRSAFRRVCWESAPRSFQAA